jgi:hypothetical protein
MLNCLKVTAYSMRYENLSRYAWIRNMYVKTYTNFWSEILPSSTYVDDFGFSCTLQISDLEV